MPDEPKKKKPSLGVVWREARDLIWARRARLGLGMALMAISRLAGLVLPATSKVLIDEVIGKSRSDLLWPLALAAGAATLVQAATGFALSQVLGIAAQKSITEMRRAVQQHVTRLPVSYFDSTKTGVLISRIMNDAEGIRNLVGNGLVQLVGSIVTASIALGVLFWLNWRLTTATLVLLAAFGGVMAMAFTRLRPIFRERGKISAEVTGRLTETLGGIRIVKAYTAEQRESLVFAKGIHRLFRNIASSMLGVSAVSAASTVIVGVIGVLMIVVGGRAILAGQMTLGDFVMYIFFTGLVAAPVVSIASIGTQVSEAFAGLDRIREVRQMATEGQEDAARAADRHGPRRGGVRGRALFLRRRRRGASRRVVPGAGRHDHGAGGVQRVRQEHAHQPGDGVQPPAGRRDPRGRPRPVAAQAARLPQPARHRPAGQLPVRRHRRRQHRLLEARRDPRGDRGGRRASRTARSSSAGSRRDTTRSSASAA